jgi:hypothetical protein
MTSIATKNRLPAEIHALSGMEIAPLPFRGFFCSATQVLLADRVRNQDLNGKDVSELSRCTGWNYCEYPVIAVATSRSMTHAVSAGWAAPIRWKEDSRIGVNLAYATMPGFEGNSLAALCTAMAFLQLCQETPAASLGMVNVQCSEQNEGSIRLCEKLGLERTSASDFTVPSLGRHFLGFHAPALDFEITTQKLLKDFCDYAHPSIETGVNHSFDYIHQR